LVLNSYAKLNLYLEVLGRRKDGYHNIRTLFERIDLSDKIILKSRRDKKIKILCNSPEVPLDNANLAFRSARLLQDTFRLDKGVDIRIKKNIPIGAGLGGGSSNAAAVLVGLNRLWNLKLAKNRLITLARRIGSDVPFFIYNIPFAQATACGDRIKLLNKLHYLRLWHILVVPKIAISTPTIYRKWDTYSKLTEPDYDVKILTLALKKRDSFLIARSLFNDLEKITAKLYPVIGRIKKKLKALGIKSILMSGSGPAVFGIASSRKEAVALSKQLKKNKFWKVFVTRTV